MKQLLIKTGKKLLNWTLLGLVLHVMTAFLPVRKMEISTFLNTSSHRADVGFFVTGEFRFSGGVVPHGSVAFLKSNGEVIDAKELSLSIISRNKMTNNISDYDAIGIKYGNDIYKVSLDDRLLYPLIKFVDRGAYTAYTIPPNRDSSYFKNNGFIKVKNAYVAQEFIGHESFLDSVDLKTRVEPIPPTMEKKIIEGFSTLYSNGEVSRTGRGSYINADFHITYQIFLETINDEKVADIAGLPLRYHYMVNANNQPIIHMVKVFQHPEDEKGLQYNSVIFFQAAAILRYFKERNPDEFAQFMNEVARTLRKN